MKTKKPNPGSDKAIKQGCKCPILDNGHGQGAWATNKASKEKKVFWVNETCPIHGKKNV